MAKLEPEDILVSGNYHLTALSSLAAGGGNWEEKWCFSTSNNISGDLVSFLHPKRY